MDVDFVSLCERGGSRKLMQTEVFSHFYDIIGFKSESVGAPGRCATCYLFDFDETWPV